MKNVYKVGITKSIKDRNNTYITGEVERGEYLCLIEIQLDTMKLIDNCLKNYFKSLNVYKGGGTEFYKRCIIDLIEPYLDKMNISYTVLSKEEINLINRCERIRNIPNVENLKNIFNKLVVKDIIQKYKNKDSKINKDKLIDVIEPNEHQINILGMIEKFL